MNTQSLSKDPLNDPMVVAVEQGNEAVPSTLNTKNDAITGFFEQLNQSMKSFDIGGSQSVPETSAPEMPLYTADYKPKDCINKKHVYSINELLAISKQMPEEISEEIINLLPKKKFWRLNRRYSDHGAHGKGVGSRNVRNFNQGLNPRPLSNEDGVYERRNSKSKTARSSHAKRNKHGKNDKNGFILEEKDIAVNNEDLLALEGEFEPTGNSMADFETWKAKMKEMELKKKGLLGNDTGNTDVVSVPTATSSSISDFLKLNSKKSEIDRVTSDSVLEGNVTLETNGNQKVEGHTEPAAAASSRFSSFFTNSTSIVSLPSPKPTEESKETAIKSVESTSSISSGSRLMSFFNKDQESREKQPSYPNNSNEQPMFMAPPGLARQEQGRGQPNIPAPYPMPPMHAAPSQQSQTNNAFFQGLLNKGKITDSPVSPPPGVPIPNNAPRLMNQGQRLGHAAPPRNVNVPPGFRMGMPPPGFGPPVQGGSLQRPNGLPMMPNNAKENGDFSNKKKNSQQPMAQHVPMQPGMYPQFVPGMAPPGFPPMQGMPQGFNPNMFVPSNGMMPGNGQQFFPPPPPPQAGVPGYGSFPSRSSQAGESKSK